jgi:hypothetical protein
MILQRHGTMADSLYEYYFGHCVRYIYTTFRKLDLLPSSCNKLSLYWQISYYLFFNISGDGRDLTRDILILG